MKDDKKTIISLEVPEDLKEQLRVAAFNEKCTISALIRKILVEKLDTTNKN